jgi:hypothetical protein
MGQRIGGANGRTSEWQVVNQQIANGGEKMNIKISRKWLVSLSLTLGMLILLWAIGSALAQGPEPQGDISAAATVNSRISYQGVLKENGNPVTGNRNMVFNFYTNNTCSGVAVHQVIKNNVPVTDGLFSVELDVTHGVFWGQGLWLRVRVGSTNLGCKEILPVPYALGLRPGAEVMGSVASPSAVLEVIQSNAGSAAFGVYGYAPKTGIYGLAVETGVMGHSYGHQGGRAGVYGESVVGVGVRGTSTSYHGVYGESKGGSGHGGHFANTQTGFSSNQVGVWAGSYWGNVIEGHEVNASGNSVDRVFRVDWMGNVYGDGRYYCGESSSCWNSGTGADVAERIDAIDALESGDVVEISPDHPGHFRRARTAFSRAVAGVVSTSPAMTMGNDFDPEKEDWNDDRPLLALVGVVPVKASAENGPIVPGDLLVASSTPGHAMKADPNPHVGTVIGKALEPLDDNTGVIQMLVMLQ